MWLFFLDNYIIELDNLLFFGWYKYKLDNNTNISEQNNCLCSYLQFQGSQDILREMPAMHKNLPNYVCILDTNISSCWLNIYYP